MQQTKMTVRVSREQLEKAKEFAAANQTTLTDLIKAYLDRIPVQHSLKNAPVVRRLSGMLSPDLKEEDYKQHLEEKYGR